MLSPIHLYQCMVATFLACLITVYWFNAVHREQMNNELPTTMRKKWSTSALGNDRKRDGQMFEVTSAAKAAQKEAEAPIQKEQRPNVLFVVCDDLNDYIEFMGGHPQAITPNIRQLMETSVTFTQAHSNIPLCKESRSSFLSGLYPHTSKYLDANTLPRPEEFDGLEHQRTLIEHFNENGYTTMGTGKIYHGYKESYWQHEGYPQDYGPFVYNKTQANHEGANDKTVQNLPHPHAPRPFRHHGPIRGSFGPLVPLEDDLGWRTGDFHHGFREMKFQNETSRDMTTDEKSAAWAIEKLQEMDETMGGDGDDKPFFLGVGLVRPHNPMIVSQKYYDMYPLETLELPPSLLDNDVNDTMRHTLGWKGVGQRMYRDLVKSFGGYKKIALKRYIQAYLASVTSADELVGKVLDALDQTRFKDNTIVVFTSDHGYELGQKDYLGKNLLWQATTRVPLLVRVPGMTTTGPTERETAQDASIAAARASASPPPPRTCDDVVSLVDLYPTLIDLCGLSKNTAKNEFSRRLDGHSLRPFLSTASDDKTSWDGPEFALSALSHEREPSDPIGMSLTTRYSEWRYVRYANGKEELYDTVMDPYEWKNLAVTESSTRIATILDKFRKDLFQFVKADGRNLQEE